MLLLPLDLDSERWRSFSGTVEDVIDLPILRDAAKDFACCPIQEVAVDTDVVAVIQGEVAAAEPGNFDGLGSDSATTCHIVAFRNPASGRTCLAHLDSCNRISEAIGCMLALVLSGDGQIESTGKLEDNETVQAAPLDLYVVGGYRGEKLAEDLSRGLLAALHASPQVFRVVLACIAGLNSRPTADGSKAEVSGVAPPSGGPCVAASARVGNSESAAATEPTNNHEEDPSETSSIKSSYDGEDKQAGKALHCKKWLPRRTSLAIDLATGRAFPVRFEGIGRGPGWEVRHSRIFAGARETVLANIYDAQSDSIVVDPYPLWINPGAISRILDLPDQELLAITSTSPDAEDDRFVVDVRTQYSYILKHVREDGEGWWGSVFGGGSGTALVFPRADTSSTHHARG